MSDPYAAPSDDRQGPDAPSGSGGEATGPSVPPASQPAPPYDAPSPYGSPPPAYGPTPPPYEPSPPAYGSAPPPYSSPSSSPYLTPENPYAGQQQPPYGGDGYAPAPPSPYGGYGYQGPTQGTSGLAIAALVCALAGLVTCISAPVGAILGHVALSQIKKTGQQGRGMALAAVIAGWAITAISILLFLAVIVLGDWSSTYSTY